MGAAAERQQQQMSAPATRTQQLRRARRRCAEVSYAWQRFGGLRCVDVLTPSCAGHRVASSPSRALTPSCMHRPVSWQRSAAQPRRRRRACTSLPSTRVPARRPSAGCPQHRSTFLWHAPTQRYFAPLCLWHLWEPGMSSGQLVRRSGLVSRYYADQRFWSQVPGDRIGRRTRYVYAAELGGSLSTAIVKLDLQVRSRVRMTRCCSQAFAAP